jgi:hypothetical protein
MREKKNQEGGDHHRKRNGKQRWKDTYKGGKERKRLGRLLERKEKKRARDKGKHIRKRDKEEEERIEKR